jgi:molybdate transport repressor ModE-like protein/molybdopterin-binding protein
MSGRTPPSLEVAADLWLSLGGTEHCECATPGAARGDSARRLAHAGRQGRGLSYKGAWDAIEQMSNLAGEPLVTRTVGGKGGGQTLLTARGQRLVDNFADIQREHARFLERLNERARGFREDFALLENAAMKTSARNQFAGTVETVRHGAVNDEVIVKVIGEQRIVATITCDSRASLGLESPPSTARPTPTRSGEVARGLEVVEFACGIPHLLKGEFTENVGTGIDALFDAPAARRRRRHHAVQLPGHGADVDVPDRASPAATPSS